MKNGEFSGLNQNENLTTEVYSSDRPENYGYTEEQRLAAVDPKIAAEKLAEQKLGYIPSPGAPFKNKNLIVDGKVMVSPTEKHRFEKAIAKGKPWDDKYKDPRSKGRGIKLGTLMEDPAGKTIDLVDDDFNNIEG